MIGKGVGIVSSLFLRSAWAKSRWWLADRQGHYYDIASVHLAGGGSFIVVAGLYARSWLWSRL
jgi:hypothetical protein